MPEREPPDYAGYDVLAKWDTPSFDPLTRGVLERRLHAVPPPRFFDAGDFATLEHACARLLATPVGSPPLANWIDADVFEGRGEGYRHPDMPALQEGWRQGLRGLDAEARRRHGAGFADLAGAQQDDTLLALQGGQADPANFAQVPAQHFFTHVLLKAAACHFYAQPQAWNEIGFGGPASPRGYVRIGLGRRDGWEAPLRAQGERR
jgi:hypothetical protein